MTRFRIQEITSYYDEYEVDAASKEEAVAIHRAQGSWAVPPVTFSECEIFDVLEVPT